MMIQEEWTPQPYSHLALAVELSQSCPRRTVPSRDPLCKGGGGGTLAWVLPIPGTCIPCNGSVSVISKGCKMTNLIPKVAELGETQRQAFQPGVHSSPSTCS